MKPLFLLCLASLASLGALSQPRRAQAQDERKPVMPLKVMTYNLRYASAQPPHSWPQRRPVASEMLRRWAPDIVGTQEGLYGQVKDIAADRPEYSWIGLGRDGGSRGEFMAVFYRRERLEPLEFDHFWLSNTPEVVGSSTWGNTNRRMVTWVKFRDRLSNLDFYFWNTHFDHALPEARDKAAALVARRVRALNTELPIVLAGDFNAPSRASKPYDILTGRGPDEGGFADAWASAQRRVGANFASFHGYNPPVADGPHIDWILLRGAVAAQEAQVVNFGQGGQYPSDHFPIMATLSLQRVDKEN